MNREWISLVCRTVAVPWPGWVLQLLVWGWAAKSLENAWALRGGAQEGKMLTKDYLPSRTLQSKSFGSGKDGEWPESPPVPHNFLLPDLGWNYWYYTWGLMWKSAPFMILLLWSNEVGKQLSDELLESHQFQEARNSLHLIDSIFLMISLPTLVNISSPCLKWRS